MKRLIFIVPPVLFMVLCTVLLTLPGDEFPEANWFSTIYLDKWIHTGMFGLMVLIFSWAFYKYGNRIITKRSIWWICIACIGYGIGMEFVQKYWVINRSFDIGDIIADTVGSVIGALVARRVYIKK